MDALVVGADRLGNIPALLEAYGIRIASHVTGRDRSHQRSAANVPAGIGLVILFTDFLGHNVMRSYRDAAGRAGARLVCCRRSVCALQQALGNSGCAGCPNARQPSSDHAKKSVEAA